MYLCLVFCQRVNVIIVLEYEGDEFLDSFIHFSRSIHLFIPCIFYSAGHRSRYYEYKIHKNSCLRGVCFLARRDRQIKYVSKVHSVLEDDEEDEDDSHER